MRRLISILISGILGAVVAIVGAVAHRSIIPFGVVLCLLLVLLSVVFVRTWAGWTAVIAYAIPFLGLSFVFTRPGPGGDLLIAGDNLGYVWLYGGAVALAIACLIPVSWLGGARRVESP